jgi:hypothetical protein
MITFVHLEDLRIRNSKFNLKFNKSSNFQIYLQRAQSIDNQYQKLCALGVFFVFFA